MEILVTRDIERDSDVLVLGLFEGDEDNYKSYNENLGKEIEEALDKKLFKKDFGEAYVSKIDEGCKRVLILGLGKKEEFTLNKVRKVVHKSLQYTKKKKMDSLSINILQLVSTMFNEKDLGRVCAEGFFLSNYSFEKYLTKENGPVEVKELRIVWANEDSLFLQGIEEGTVVAESTNFARDLVNEPAMVVTPVYLEKVAEEIAEHEKISLKVLEDDALYEQGLNALLGVSQGSDHPARLIILEYNGVEEGPWTAIVGKGITFDSGGLSLKPSSSMLTMKSDMAGAAAVLGTMKAIASLGVKKKILGVVPACENTINGSAYKLGDILTAYNKKTIEITNTDAEGRLILADALSYAEDKYKPEIMIDLATLTGACSVALGSQFAGLVCEDKELREKLIVSGEESYDKVWHLPFPEEYKDSMKGDISDLKNTGPRNHGAGAITAAVFLSKFVSEARWAHLDIAGPAFLTESKDYLEKGASGAGTRTLVYYFMKK